jgi:hypothetical protein
MKTPQNGMSNQTDVKIFILFLMDNINYPLDYSTIHDICIQNGYVGGFDFAACFSQLKELGHILEDSEEGETYYVISPTGKMVSAELQSNLLLSIREKSLKSAMRLLSFKKRQATTASAIEKRDDGKYTLCCSITEPGGNVLKLELCLSSRLQAESMQKKFDKEPESVYRRLLSVLSADADYVLS